MKITVLDANRINIYIDRYVTITPHTHCCKCFLVRINERRQYGVHAKTIKYIPRITQLSQRAYYNIFELDFVMNYYDDDEHFLYT